MVRMMLQRLAYAQLVYVELQPTNAALAEIENLCLVGE